MRPKLQRIGRFIIEESKVTGSQDGAELLDLFARVVVVEAKWDYVCQGFVYSAISPDFDLLDVEIRLFQDAPMYHPQFVMTWDRKLKFVGWDKTSWTKPGDSKTKGHMDTRDGKFYEGGLESLTKLLNAAPGDLVPVGNLPAQSCEKCGGKGYKRRGLFSRRFKPCECTNPR